MYCGLSRHIAVYCGVVICIVGMEVYSYVCRCVVVYALVLSCRHSCLYSSTLL